MSDTAPFSEPQASQPSSTRARTSQLAVWSLVVALVGLLPALRIAGTPYLYLNYHSSSNWRLVGLGAIFAVVGIVLGVIALNRIKRTPRRGQGLAAAGIAVGSFVLGIVLFAFRLTF